MMDELQLESKSLICLLFGEQDYEEAEHGGSVILMLSRLAGQFQHCAYR